METQLADTKVTERILKEDVEDSLKAYYKRKKQLTEYISVARELLETSQKEIRELEKRHTAQLKLTGAYKPKVRLLWDHIKANPGLIHHEVIKGFIEEKAPGQNYQAVQGMCSELQYKGNLNIINGLYYASASYQRLKDTQPYGYMAEHVRAILIEKKTLTQLEIDDILREKRIHINRKSVRGALRNFVLKGHVSTNQKFRNQKNVIYTWIGGTNV